MFRSEAWPAKEKRGSRSEEAVVGIARKAAVTPMARRDLMEANISE